MLALAVRISVGSLILAGLCASTAVAPAEAAITDPFPATRLGVYTQPGAKGIVGAKRFEEWSGGHVSQILDFAGASDWSQISRPNWILDQHVGTPTRLELSIPMLPDDPSTTLAKCASGAYNSYWTVLGWELAKRGLKDTVIRPGWEFNGNWYRWSAAGQPENYVKCFRQIVTQMRKDRPGGFAFVWNPNIGPGSFPAEQAYPGDEYVDLVGVDVYDTSWTSYPVVGADDAAATAAAQTAAWNWIYKGDHGLLFWSAFAKAHGKPLSLDEWGVTWRSDGHGGNDNASFVDRMADFISAPIHNVAYANYFEIDVPTRAHELSSSNSLFPDAAERFQSRIKDLGSSPRCTS